VVGTFPKLAAAAAEATAVARLATPTPQGRSGGRHYRQADEDIAVAERDPFPTDPAVVDRALRSHRQIQNAAAAVIEAAGLVPQRPDIAEPLYDLSWWDGEFFCVAEVKSLTARNEEPQLRLGLGQVLRYRQRLGTPAVRCGPS
jgi:hypothetical protein